MKFIPWIPRLLLSIYANDFETQQFTGIWWFCEITDNFFLWIAISQLFMLYNMFLLDLGPLYSYNGEKRNLMLDKPEDTEEEDSPVPHMGMKKQPYVY